MLVPKFRDKQFNQFQFSHFKSMSDYLQKMQAKIQPSTAEISKILDEWRGNNEKIVFSNGCFDILHQGHVVYLAKAACLGSKLVIGLNTDNSVKRLKGENRPINHQNERALLLSALEFVDMVIFFEEGNEYILEFIEIACIECHLCVVFDFIE